MHCILPEIDGIRKEKYWSWFVIMLVAVKAFVSVELQWKHMLMRIIPSHSWNMPSFLHGSLWWRDKTGESSFYSVQNSPYTYAESGNLSLSYGLSLEPPIPTFAPRTSQSPLLLLPEQPGFFRSTVTPQNSKCLRRHEITLQVNSFTCREALGFLRMCVFYQNLKFVASRFFSMLRRTILKNSTEKCQFSNHVSVLCKDTENQGTSLGTCRTQIFINWNLRVANRQESEKKDQIME